MENRDVRGLIMLLEVQTALIQASMDMRAAKKLKVAV
jgi:hypothetical protein